MTKETAKKVFDFLLAEIRSKGFTDIGTFMIDEVQKGNEYEQYDEKYEYIDTEKVISNIEMLSNSPEGATYALARLVDAGIEYFQLASQIPSRYAAQLNEFDIGDSVSSKIILESIDGKSVNIDLILSDKSIFDLISLFKQVKYGIDQDDETFLNSFE